MLKKFIRDPDQFNAPLDLKEDLSYEVIIAHFGQKGESALTTHYLIYEDSVEEPFKKETKLGAGG